MLLLSHELLTPIVRWMWFIYVTVLTIAGSVSNGESWPAELVGHLWISELVSPKRLPVWRFNACLLAEERVRERGDIRGVARLCGNHAIVLGDTERYGILDDDAEPDDNLMKRVKGREGWRQDMSDVTASKVWYPSN